MVAGKAVIDGNVIRRHGLDLTRMSSRHNENSVARSDSAWNREMGAQRKNNHVRKGEIKEGKEKGRTKREGSRRHTSGTQTHTHTNTPNANT